MKEAREPSDRPLTRMRFEAWKLKLRLGHAMRVVWPYVDKALQNIAQMSPAYHELPPHQEDSKREN